MRRESAFVSNFWMSYLLHFAFFAVAGTFIASQLGSAHSWWWTLLYFADEYDDENIPTNDDDDTQDEVGYLSSSFSVIEWLHIELYITRLSSYFHSPFGRVDFCCICQFVVPRHILSLCDDSACLFTSDLDTLPGKNATSLSALSCAALAGRTVVEIVRKEPQIRFLLPEWQSIHQFRCLLTSWTL